MYAGLFIIVLILATVFICSVGYIVTAILEANLPAKAEYWGRAKSKWGLALAILVFFIGMTVIFTKDVWFIK